MVSLGIIYALLLMTGVGLTNAVAKAPSERVGNVQTIFWRGLFLAPLMLCIALFNWPSHELASRDLLIAVGIALVGYLPLMLFYRALSLGKVGVVSPVLGTTIIYTTMLSMVFYGEQLSGAQLAGIIAIIIGVVLVSVDFRQWRGSDMFSRSSGVPHALGAAFLWGLVFFLLKIPNQALGPFLTSTITEAGVLVGALAHLALTRKSPKMPDKKSAREIAVLVILGPSILFFYFAIQMLDVSVVSAIMFSSPLVAALYGALVYKERLTIQQYFAIVLLVTGIVILSLA